MGLVGCLSTQLVVSSIEITPIFSIDFQTKKISCLLLTLFDSTQLYSPAIHFPALTHAISLIQYAYIHISNLHLNLLLLYTLNHLAQWTLLNH